MSRIEMFSALLDETKEQYIGYGNPESQILIVGKECGLDSSDPTYRLEVESNVRLWKRYLKNPDAEITDWVTVAPDNPDEWEKYFSPRFAFWGQENHWQPRGKYNRGTSRTWLLYQRLIDGMTGRVTPKNSRLTFQDSCFITELSAIPKKMSVDPDIDKTKMSTKMSIIQRCNRTFLGSDFFQSFPIVIASCKGYQSYMPCGIEQLFPHAEKLIITKQLSMFVSHDYINGIVDILTMESKERIARYL